jgi:hypothetical protein
VTLRVEWEHVVKNAETIFHDSLPSRSHAARVKVVRPASVLLCRKAVPGFDLNCSGEFSARFRESSTSKSLKRRPRGVLLPGVACEP